MKPNNKNRRKKINRHHRFRMIKRKKKIVLEIYKWNSGLHFPEGKLSKGKVHCSCWMCSEKSKFRGHPTSEQAKRTAMKNEIYDYLDGNY